MFERPILNKQLCGSTFLSFYYLKKELVNFCRNSGLPVSGGKMEIAKRIFHYRNSGEVLIAKSISKNNSSREEASRGKLPRSSSHVSDIAKSTQAETDFICSEKHRAFFQKKIGEILGKKFSFNIAFQKWIKSNPQKTYAQTIEAYFKILA